MLGKYNLSKSQLGNIQKFIIPAYLIISIKKNIIYTLIIINVFKT